MPAPTFSQHRTGSTPPLERKFMNLSRMALAPTSDSKQSGLLRPHSKKSINQSGVVPPHSKSKIIQHLDLVGFET
jgi:hypothetical protein